MFQYLQKWSSGHSRLLWRIKECKFPRISRSGLNWPPLSYIYCASAYMITYIDCVKCSKTPQSPSGDGFERMFILVWSSSPLVQCKNITNKPSLSFTAAPKDTAGDFWFIYTHFHKDLRSIDGIYNQFINISIFLLNGICTMVGTVEC